METEETCSSSSGTEIEMKDTGVSFSSFIASKYNGLIQIITDDSELVVTARPLILAFHNFNKYGAQLESWCNEIAESAADYADRVDFAIADFNALTIGAKWNKFNYELLGPKSRPRYFAFDLQGNQYRKDEFLSRSTLKQFALLLLKEQLLITEPIPEDDIINRVKIAVGGSLKQIISSTQKDIFIVFYITKNKNSKELLSKLEELARMLQHENLLIVKMNAAENHIPPDFNMVSYPRCFYIRKGDKTHYIQYEQEKFEIVNLIEFIAAHSTKELESCDHNGMLKEELRFKTELHLYSLTHIRSLVKNNHNDVFQVITQIDVSEKPLIVAFHYFMRLYAYLEPWCDVIEEVAKQFEGEINFAIADINAFSIGEHKFEREYFTANAIPWVFAFDKDAKQYRFKEFLSAAALSNFCNKLLQKELTTSDVLPVQAIDPLVKVGTKDNFNELVTWNKKDVFLLLYANWSYYHKKELETLEYLASLLQDDENQLVVKVDATAESVPPYHKICCFPTYVFVTNKHIENRNYWMHDIEQFIKFIAENSRYELKYYDREGYLRKEYKRKSWIKPLQSVLTAANNEEKEQKEAEKEADQCFTTHKLGNIITTTAFEALLILRETDDDENIEVAEDAKVAICRNLNEFILSTEKDIFIVIYSYFNNKMRKVLNELASLLSDDVDSIVVAKINTKAYPVPPHYNIIFDPKCIFIPKNDKTNFIELNSKQCDVNIYLRFIAAHSTAELTNYDCDGALKKKLDVYKEEAIHEGIFHLMDAYDVSLEKVESSNYKQDIMDYICKTEYNGLLDLLCPEQGEHLNFYAKPLIVLVHNIKKFKSAVLSSWSEYLLPVLQEFQGKIRFFLCDCELFKRYQSGCKFANSHIYPDIYSIDSSNRLYKREYDNFRDFTLKSLNNEYFKTEPISQEQTGEFLKKAVTDNLEQLTCHSQSDVFLLIYNSTWYEDEPQALQTLEGIAELFHDEDIEFVRIDAAKNYIPLEFSIGGYFFQKNRKNQPLRFQSYNSSKCLLAFLSANATDELKSYNRKGIPKKRFEAEY